MLIFVLRHFLIKHIKDASHSLSPDSSDLLISFPYAVFLLRNHQTLHIPTLAVPSTSQLVQEFDDQE